ncbi:MAG: phenylalanine--tRNA ligase beta subunit-related protein [Bacteroidota bacterium]|nr:phenylalanine--tRNA ligase beta subunit-related protein [Bacteroidota bacterium]
MIKIRIADILKDKLKNLAIGSIQSKVQVKESDDELHQLLDNACNDFSKNYTVQDISKLPPIADSRKAYKVLGKDPARYRLSSEALLRRIVKEKGIYKINNIVDINNLVSITSFYSICAFDISKLQPPVQFTIGSKEDVYYGIGRGVLNIENLPVFEDQKGKFGSPTSDSERVKITSETENLSMNIISFSGKNDLEIYLNQLKDYLVKYANAENVEMKIFV